MSKALALLSALGGILLRPSWAAEAGGKVCDGEDRCVLAGPPFVLDYDFGSASATSKVKLNDGRDFPMFGLGVYLTQPGPEAVQATEWAFKAGYRMIDTADIYQNEADVGEAFRRSGLKREDVYITTKLWDAHHGYEAALGALTDSLQKLQMDYIDLYLIHSPNTGKIVETWDALVQAQKLGLVRSIGVSNYGVQHLEALEKHGRSLPTVNQVEMHPMIWKEREEMMNYCKARGIIVEAYGSLFAGQNEWLQDAGLNKVAQETGKSVGQVLLRWGLQMGFALIPKSVKEHRIKENMDIFGFELSAAQMEVLSSMQGRLRAYWDPLTAPVDLGDLSRKEPK